MIADPLFENKSDPAACDYQLNLNSPALKAGFIQIPFNEIGLNKNKFSEVLPVSDK